MAIDGQVCWTSSRVALPRCICALPQLTKPLSRSEALQEFPGRSDIQLCTPPSLCSDPAGSLSLPSRW